MSSDQPNATDPIALGPPSPPAESAGHPFHWLRADGVLTIAKWDTNRWLLPGYSGAMYPAVTQGWSYVSPAVLPWSTPPDNGPDEEAEEFDMWEALGVRCGGYSSGVDADIIAVMKEIAGPIEGRFMTEIATKLRLPEHYVETIQFILCSVDLCEYGTSPRGCRFKSDKEASDFIAKCEVYYRRNWCNKK